MTAASPTLLVIGSGGREHAITESLLRSPRGPKVFVAPGNAGTEAHNVALDVSDHAAVAAFCAERAVDLVVVGPEAPLVAGLVDDLRRGLGRHERMARRLPPRRPLKAYPASGNSCTFATATTSLGPDSAAIERRVRKY